MDTFDLKKYLAEGQLNENKFDIATTEKIAQTIADTFTAEDDLDLKYTVTPGTEESSFDLDVERGANTPDKDSRGQDIENYLGDTAGGSFYIKDGVVYNAAMRNAPVANVSPEGEVEMISAADSRAAIGMEEGEEKKSNKMKKSELKEMIKSAFLNEKETFDQAFDRIDKEEEVYPGSDKDSVKESEFATNKPGRVEDFIKALDDLIEEYHAELYLNDELFAAIDAVKMAAKQEMGRDENTGDIPGFEGTMDALDSLSIREEEEEDVDVEDTEDIDIETDVEATDGDDIDVTDNADVEMTGDKKEIQDNLQAALEAAKALGDQKLIDQIGNSITFFTRTHIVGKNEVAEVESNLNESINRMQKLAGLIK